MGRGDGGSSYGWVASAGVHEGARIWVLSLNYEIWIGCGAVADELNGHKKTVSESETVTGQYLEIRTETLAAESGKPTVSKTFRSSRGSLPDRVSRFINGFFGWSMVQNYSIVTLGNSLVIFFFGTGFLKFYFQHNRVSDALFLVFFAAKKNTARVTSRFASTTCLNFSFLFCNLNWRAATFRRRTAHEVLGISWAASFPAGTTRVNVTYQPKTG